MVCPCRTINEIDNIIILGSGDGVAPNKRQGITWTIGDIVSWDHGTVWRHRAAMLVERGETMIARNDINFELELASRDISNFPNVFGNSTGLMSSSPLQLSKAFVVLLRMKPIMFEILFVKYEIVFVCVKFNYHSKYIFRYLKWSACLLIS